MFPLTRRIRSTGQVTVEVAVLFGFVVAGLVAMAVYLQRGVQGGVKSNADSLGTQFQANAPWTVNSNSHTIEDQVTVTTDQDTHYNQSVN
ncbi:MAG: hypothetical protein HYZ91_07040 [Candidatus Omnitrophica bacterium]|nr:hypothetical protein [Candidatus Omnitrophota bacterium]